MTPKTFASIRSSHDHGLAAFAAALLLASALSAGAFLPRIDAPAAGDARASTPAYAAAEQAPAKRG